MESVGTTRLCAAVAPPEAVAIRWKGERRFRLARNISARMEAMTEHRTVTKVAHAPGLVTI